MTYPKPPLSDVQRDNLIRTLTEQVRRAEAARDDAYATVRDLQAELVMASQEIAALKRGLVPEQPFG